MKQAFTYREKAKQFFIILFPILVTQVGLSSMNFFDTTMSGNASPDDLAGVAIGSSLWVPIFTGLSGILLSVTPIVAQMVGAKEKEKVPFTVIQAVYLSIILAIIIIGIGALILDPILNTMNLDPNVREIAKNYLIALAAGMIPLFIYQVLRCFIDALGQTRVSMIITLMSLPINIILNYCLIFGEFGFPRLGGVGAGVATAVTYWCILAISVWIIAKVRPFSDYKIFSKLYKLSPSSWKEILKIGVPIGFAIFFEVSIFSAVTLLMSSYNTVTIASHQAALNFASLLYMIPMSIAMALTILVGFEVGASRLRDARQYSWLGIGLAVALSMLCAAFLFFFRGMVAGFYTSDPDVLRLTKHFLIYAIFFQLSDAIAAPVQGALRGYKDVNVTFVMALISYWVIGLPLGYVLANYTGWEAFGYWIGLIAGLAAGAIGLFWRLAAIQRQTGRKEKRIA